MQTEHSPFISGSPFNLSFWTPTLYIAFIFNYYIKRRYADWWSKYAYILGTGFSVGIALCGFFMVRYVAPHSES